jgi:hypothetical protein
MFRFLVECRRECWREVSRGGSKYRFVQVGDLRKLCLVTTALCVGVVDKSYARAWIVGERSPIELGKVRHLKVE